VSNRPPPVRTVLEHEELPEVRSISIIVPILNEIDSLPVLVAQLESIDAEQLLIIDGGSTDGSYQWLRQHWLNFDHSRVLLSSAAGRAHQMNLAASSATEDVLLFLHADCVLPKGARQEILYARDRQHLWGRFDVSFQHTEQTSTAFKLAMQVIAVFMNIRSRLTSIATGDQAIFVDRQLFSNLGGFANIPLMEDVALSTQLKRHSVPYCSPHRVITSARRWQQGGVARTVVLMWYLRLAYFCGTSAQKLAEQYRQTR
jgi:rSAM/selenodomain-associated transferase 2